MDRFGSDKPDTRFGLELVDVTDIVRGSGFGVFNSAIEGGGSVRCICVKGGVEKFPRKKIDELVEFVKIYRAKGMAWMSLKPEGLQCSFAKFLTEAQIAEIQKAAGAEQGDILFFVADAKNEVVYASLGALRVEVAKRLDLIDQTKFDVLWVTDFPLLEWDEEENRYVACHHPFTSPKDEDIALLDTDPGKARAKAYDMVINGYEAAPSESTLQNCRRKCSRRSVSRRSRHANVLGISLTHSNMALRRTAALPMALTGL